MSYQYRKAKRNKCHFVLKILYLKQVESINPNQDVTMTLLEITSLQAYKRIRERFIWQKSSKVSYIDSLIIQEILIENKFVNIFGTHPTTIPKLAITPKGIDAYKENYFGVENRKDLKEWLNLKLFWIVPVTSFVFSSFAFWLSLKNSRKQDSDLHLSLKSDSAVKLIYFQKKEK